MVKMKKNSGVLGLVSVLILATMGAALCEPKNSACDSSCDTLFNVNLLSYNTSWHYHGPNNWDCESTSSGNPRLTVVNGSTVGLWGVPAWDNMTTDFIYVSFSGSPNATEAIDIGCPSYGFMNTSVTITDCYCDFSNLYSCNGTELWVPYINFNDVFFAGLGAGLGSTCSSGGECSSGNCVDGVCCDTSCVGTCQRCDLAGSNGTCTDTPSGEDLDDECGGVGCDGGAVTPYYWGWDGPGFLTCYYPQDVLDSTCNGAGACYGASDYCNGQPMGDTTGVTCDCAGAEVGCSGTTIGTCDNGVCPTTTTTLASGGGGSGYFSAHPIVGAVVAPVATGTPSPAGPAPLAVFGGGGGALPSISDVLFSIPSPHGQFDVTVGKAIVLAMVVGLPTLLLAFKAFTFKLR